MNKFYKGIASLVILVIIILQIVYVMQDEHISNDNQKNYALERFPDIHP